MRTYEALYIVRPDLPDDEIQTVANDVESLVTESGGAVVRSETWGKRRLAYEVQKCQEGCFVLLRFQATAAFVAQFENHFRLTEAVIRYLIVHFDERTLRLEEDQQRRVEEEIRSSAARPRARALAVGDDDTNKNIRPTGGVD